MLSIKQFEDNYFQTDGKIIDKQDATLSLLPFNLNPSTSGFDKNCGLSGTTGAFFRKWGRVEVKPIVDYKLDVEDPVTSFLHESGKMQYAQQTEFMKVVEDILYPDGKMSVIDATFLPYLPLVDGYTKGTRAANKYSDGQTKLAEYLYSMLEQKKMPKELSGESNLFSSTIRKGMERGSFSNLHNDGKYYILPFVEKLFNEDIKWLMGKEDYVIVRYINYLLHFYVCLSVSQTIAHLAYWEEFSQNDIIPFYYMLASEHASETRGVVETGWEKWLSKDILQKLSARMQAIDIFNTIASKKPIGLYPQVVDYLGEDSFEDNKAVCEAILESYHKKKYDLLIHRSNITADDIYTDFDYQVSSYKEFYKKLLRLCVDFQSPEYKNRLEKKVKELFEVKFLRNRKGLRVLVLDEDILIFLIAMMTKEKRVKLDDMYKMFNSYGIHFDMRTRTAIEAQLIKLNLLDRKSDSGEAQYVKVVL